DNIGMASSCRSAGFDSEATRGWPASHGQGVRTATSVTKQTGNMGDTLLVWRGFGERVPGAELRLAKRD
ncbi:MAG TPA: hypothetical protein VEK15_25605, partial [Vicinamibacteria bacterium]|nr:hypothetical protein [Vicinamibacteria bacterium]